MASGQTNTGGIQVVQSQLDALIEAIEAEIESVSGTFLDLAARTEQMMQLAGAIVACAEDPRMHATLRHAQAMGEMSQTCTAERIAAMTRVLSLVDDEVELMQKLSQLTLGQKKIARECDVLSLLTNIEVARLGESGNGFHYLAQELKDFSSYVVADMQQLIHHVEERRRALASSKQRLASELPHTQAEFSRIAVSLQGALQAVDAGLRQLEDVPAKFRACMQELSLQIAGVVSAIQAHDITRQQLEHVRDGLAWIALSVQTPIQSDARASSMGIDPGLRIQSYQLQNARAVLNQWVSQIESCMGSILELSAADLLDIAPLVLRQEQELSSRLARIETLESTCESSSRSLHQTFAGLTSMTDLVREHLRESTAVRDRLQLLTFNSIIESGRLGKDGAAILNISHSIKGVSVDWSEITAKSREVMDHMTSLVEHSGKSLESFSVAKDDEVHKAREQTSAGMSDLHAAMLGAAKDTARLEKATEQLRALIVRIGSRGSLFAHALMSMDALIQQIEELYAEYPRSFTNSKDDLTMAEMERVFAASYTTEMEREVMRAAVRGDPLPLMGGGLAGNDAELF